MVEVVISGLGLILGILGVGEGETGEGKVSGW